MRKIFLIIGFIQLLVCCLLTACVSAEHKLDDLIKAEDKC